MNIPLLMAQEREYLALLDSPPYIKHKNGPFAFSHRMTDLRDIKYAYITDRNNTITCSFKVNGCIYAYLYASSALPTPASAFVCFGGVFLSQDGEYRSRLITFDYLQSTLAKYSDRFDKIETSIITSIANGSLFLQVDTYYPDTFTAKKSLEDNINTCRAPIKLLLACCVVDYYLLDNQIIENHLSSTYKSIIKEITTCYPEMRAGLDNFELATIVRSLESAKLDSRMAFSLRLGQKMSPLTLNEIINTGDIQYKIWREMYISQLCSKLFINLVSPAFSVAGGWFYIHNSKAELFDNEVTRERYHHSTIAAQISEKLLLADQMNYTSNTAANPVNAKFSKLSKKLKNSIKYADSDIRLSKYAVCCISEYVGRTFKDIPSLITACKGSDILPDTGYEELKTIFTDINNFSSYLFEYIYALTCMHSKVGVIHGDIHMNNITINQSYCTHVTINPTDYRGFLIGDDLFAFPSRNTYATIIDFSRSIITNKQSISDDFSPLYAKLYFKDQRRRILALLSRQFPSLTEKYQDKIESLFLDNFKHAFKIFSCLDIYMLVKSMKSMLTINNEAIKISAPILAFLDSISINCEDMMTASISSAEIEWPGLALIRLHFAKHIVTPANIKEKKLHCAEFFNYNNKLHYSATKYEHWSPLMKINDPTPPSPITTANETIIDHNSKDIFYNSWMLT